MKNFHKDLSKYFSDDLKKINRLLFAIDQAVWNVNYGEPHFLCDNGACEVSKEYIDDDIGNCFYCGTELIKHNGDWYHHTAFIDGVLIDENFQTHNNYGAAFPDPKTEEEKELIKRKKALEEFLLTLKKN
jgi:hypothetical protein